MYLRRNIKLKWKYSSKAQAPHICTLVNSEMKYQEMNVLNIKSFTCSQLLRLLTNVNIKVLCHRCVWNSQLKWKQTSLTFPGGIIVGATVANKTEQFPFSTVSLPNYQQHSTKLEFTHSLGLKQRLPPFFLGDFLPSGRQNCTVKTKLKFMLMVSIFSTFTLQ